MTNTNSALFEGARAVIFGGAKGIGKAVASEWARRGAKVAVCDIDETAAKVTASEIERSGGKAIAIRVDITSDDSVREASRAAEAAYGEIDILMNNVGAALNGYPEDIPMAEWRRITELNYFGTLRGIEYFMPKMIERRAGHIVNTASFAGLYPYASSRLPYAATKAAVISLSEGLALHLEPRGVSVSCLVPGPVMTDIMASMTSWSKDCVLVGPGAGLEMISADETAQILSDAMCQGRILIPTHEAAWDTLRTWAASPDDFIRGKIADFASGDYGRPAMSPEMIAQLQAGRDR